MLNKYNQRSCNICCAPDTCCFKCLPFLSSLIPLPYSVLSAALFFFFFSPFWPPPWHREFPGRGSDPSQSRDLHCICSHAGSLTHSSQPGIEPGSCCSQDAVDPVASQWELPTSSFNVSGAFSFCVIPTLTPMGETLSTSAASMGCGSSWPWILTPSHNGDSTHS